MRHLHEIRARRGQVALEVLLVIAAWWVLIIAFVNIMLVLSSMMAVQSTVNRLAVQVGAMGCYPERQFEADLANTLSGFAVGPTGANFEVTPIYRPMGKTPPSPGQAPLTRDTGSGISRIPNCVPRTTLSIPANEEYVPRDSYVTVTLRYEQRLFFLRERVSRSATTISSRLESGS